MRNNSISFIPTFLLFSFVLLFVGYYLFWDGKHTHLVNNVCKEACSPYEVLACSEKEDQFFHWSYVNVFAVCNSSQDKTEKKQVIQVVGYK